MRQFAFHLARTVARTVDVDGMLEGMDPGMFSQWLEYYQLQPWGDDWLQAGVVASTAKNYIVMAMSANAGERVKDSDLSTPEDFVPSRKKRKKKKKSMGATLQESLAILKSRIGA